MVPTHAKPHESHFQTIVCVDVYGCWFVVSCVYICSSYTQSSIRISNFARGAILLNQTRYTFSVWVLSISNSVYLWFDFVVFFIHFFVLLLLLFQFIFFLYPSHRLFRLLYDEKKRVSHSIRFVQTLFNFFSFFRGFCLMVTRRMSFVLEEFWFQCTFV